MRQMKDTPEFLVVDGKVAEFGVFKEPFKEINLLDIDLKIKGRSVPRFIRNLRLKEWQHFGVVHERYYFGMVIFDAKYLGTSFFYVYDRETGDFFEHSRNTVTGPISVARELWHGECHFRHFGYRMRFENRIISNLHRMRVDIRASRGKPPVKADIRLLEDIDRYRPLVVVSPVGANRPLYTHKAACPVEGKVELGDRAVELDPEKHVGLMDVQKTFYPYNTFWKWATFGGYDSKGRLIAMNACKNFIAEDERYNENCTWVDGKITLLSAAHFEFDQKALLDKWRVTTSAGDLDLEFTPAGERKGRIQLGVVMSDFHQPFGQFAGKMAGPRSDVVPVEGMFGLCEYHLARF